MKLDTITERMLGFYVNKKGQAAWIHPDVNFGRNRVHMFTPENTSIDDDIAFMVFYDRSRNVERQFEHGILYDPSRNVGDLLNIDGWFEHGTMMMPSSIQHDGGDMFSTRSRVDPNFCEKIMEKSDFEYQGNYWWKESSLYKEREDFHKLYNPDYKNDTWSTESQSIPWVFHTGFHVFSPKEPTSTVIE